ncbi:MAG: TlpA family protein disulfide reductase [Bacteroidales bacterium]|nr:TlpA family protein disulfide reductase [Bacteroidales bacterium]
MKIKVIISIVTIIYLHCMPICSQNLESGIPTPSIHYGIAHLEIRLSNKCTVRNKSYTGELSVSDPFYGERDIVFARKADGYYQFDIPVLFETFAHYEIGNIQGWCNLLPKDTTYISIGANGTAEPKKILNIDEESFLKDIFAFMQLNDLDGKIPYHKSEPNTQQNLLSHSLALNDYALRQIDALALPAGDKELSKVFIQSSILSTLFGYVKSNKEITTERINEIKANGKFFHFLKQFDLNNPMYLYAGGGGLYSDFLNFMVSDNQVLGISPIQDEPISEWIQDVKQKLSDKVGFEDGIFYNELIVAAYCKYLRDHIPLTDNQKTQITDYFHGNSFEQYLLAMNNELLIRIKNSNKAQICQVGCKKDFLRTLIKQHRGKVIYIDFWQTWCGPCKESIKGLELLKKSVLRDKDIVYIYIAGQSSPYEYWKRSINEMAGLHYYLYKGDEEWIKQECNIQSYPTTFIYDKTGHLIKRGFLDEVVIVNTLLK